MINLTEESGPSHDIQTTETEPPLLPPRRLVVVVVAAYFNFSNCDVPPSPVKNVVEGDLVFMEEGRGGRESTERHRVEEEEEEEDGKRFVWKLKGVAIDIL